MKSDVMYVEAPGDIVSVFDQWRAGGDMAGSTSIPFSAQVFDFCRANGLSLYAISACSREAIATDGRFTVRNMPKATGRGVAYHLLEVWFALRLFALCLSVRPRFVVICSGVTAHWFALWPLRLLGARVYPCLHNALWPAMPGSTPRDLRLIDRVNLALLPWVASGTLAVSPTIDRQIVEACGPRAPKAWQFRAQFRRKDFEPPPPPANHSTKPFRVAFAGRVEMQKGVFDILDMAEALRDEGVVFDVCGGGTVLEAVREACRSRGLDGIVTFRGALDRPRLIDIYTRAHCAIVPTRSGFAEGLPMVLIESILLGRPVVSSSLSNALDVLGDAIAEARPDDPASYVVQIRRLKEDRRLYEKLCASCSLNREQFLDGRMGLESVLGQALLGNPAPEVPQK